MKTKIKHLKGHLWILPDNNLLPDEIKGAMVMKNKEISTRLNRILKKIEERKTHILNTHGHFDCELKCKELELVKKIILDECEVERG